MHKTKPAHKELITRWQKSGKGGLPFSDYAESFSYGADSITYDDGPQYQHNKLVWKRCHHVRENQWSIDGTPYVGTGYDWINRPFAYYWYPHAGLTPGSFSAKSHLGSMSDLFDKVMAQIDLNSQEHVLLYSGVLQAVPLVGSAFKLTSILNRAARKLKKSFLKQPFTTVVKSLISLDFVDRFVIAPTLDDARRFQDATDYILRVMTTLNERNTQPTALQAEETYERVTRTGNASSVGPVSSGALRPTTPYCYYSFTEHTQTKAKLCLLADLSYDSSAVDPIKLWADRVGLTRPLDSVWDLVPFSFVIDYFSRAGDFISGLSDQMASQDALKGRITSVRGCWSSRTTFSGRTYRVTRCDSLRAVDDRSYSEILPKGTARFGTTVFDRAPENFFTLSAQHPPEGLLSWNLTSRRFGTLAELLIQAKL